MNTNTEYEKEIFEIVKNNPQRYGRMLKAKGSKHHKTNGRQHLYNYILEQTSFLNSLNPPILVRLFYLKHHICKFPSCIICGNPIKEFHYSKSPEIFGDSIPFLNSQTCSKKHSIELAQKSREVYFSTNYGSNITNVFQLPKTKEKIKDTKEFLHGNRNYVNLEKIKETNLKNHGAEYIFQTEEFKKKAEQSKLTNFGYKHQMQCPEIVNGMKERYLAAHGVEYSFQNPEVIDKIRQKYFYDGIYFDSSWELSYYIWLKDNERNFIYQPNIVLPYIVDGKIHYYRPDFLIENEIYEIKGDQFFNKDGTMKSPWTYNFWTKEDKERIDKRYEAKHQCMIQNKVKILRNADILPYIEYVKKKYGDEYLKQYKISND